MENKSIEQFYESVILPRFNDDIDTSSIKWIRHGKVDQDAYAHYFATGEREFVLLYEDFPSGAFLTDGLSHIVVTIGYQTSIELRLGTESKSIPNIIGWFTLFKEITK
jgi:hypothetical protein